ncbi:MAG: hypothetical protein ACE5D4_04120 [Thermodesulfobacteriota bacterium]
MVQRIRYLNLFLLLLLLPLSAFLIRNYLLYRHTPHGGAPVRLNRTSPPAERPLHRYAPIIETALFPTSARELTPIGSVERSGEKSKVYDIGKAKNITLLGVVVGLEGYAIFKDKGSGKEELFTVGDDVFSAGILKEVTEDGAVLEVGTRQVAFALPKENMKRYVPSPSGYGKGNSMEGQRDTASTPTPGRSLKYSRQVGAGEWVINRRAVMNALEDMGQVLTAARITPHMAGGKVEGFMITEIRPRGIFDALGLKNGDVLVRVNNYDMVSPERAMQVLSGLKGANEINLDLIRGGTKTSFHYQVR